MLHCHVFVANATNLDFLPRATFFGRCATFFKEKIKFIGTDNLKKIFIMSYGLKRMFIISAYKQAFFNNKIRLRHWSLN